MGVMVTYRQYVLYICTLRTYVNSRTVVSACVRAKVMVPRLLAAILILGLHYSFLSSYIHT